MKKIKSLTFVLAATSLILFAFMKPPVVKYKVDTKASTLVWTGKKVTGEHTGNVQLSSGDITAEGKNVKSGSFEIDLSALTVTDVKDPQSNAKLANHLKNEDFFNVAKYPKASFIITSVTPQVDDNFLVKGKLTIKGITNDIEFPATIKTDAKKLEASGKIKVDRSKYDIRFRSPSFFENLGDKAIYDEFELDLKLIAISTSGV